LELLEALLIAIAGFAGGFVNTLAGNGSAFTLPALEFFGLPNDVANGTNRFSIIAVGLVGTLSFYRQGLIDWRKGGWIAVLTALGTIVGSFIAVGISEVILDTVVITALLLILGLLLVKPDRWIEGEEGTLKPFGWGQGAAYFVIGVYAGLIILGVGFFWLAALVLLTGYDVVSGNAIKVLLLLVAGLQSLLIFGETGEVNWAAGIPLALGSAAGAYLAAKLATQDRAKVWVYRFLVLVVVLAIVHLVIVDSEKFVHPS
jgi:uncharacterized protein